MEVAFISGERGIGKTSLAQFVHWYAEVHLGALGAYVQLGGVQDLDESVRAMIQRLLQEGIGKPWYAKLSGFVKYIRQVGLFGVTVEFEPPPEELRAVVRNFIPSVKQLCQHLKDDRKGLLLILDNINGLVQTKEFADWLKGITDEAATAKGVPLCLILVGLDEFRYALIRSNKSLARILFPINIQLWDDKECSEFFRNSFSRVHMIVTDKALETIVNFSGGHPALAHEIGDAVFRMDDDGVIDTDDAHHGIAQAAEIIGREYLEPKVYQEIRSPRYRKILHVLASRPDKWAFQRAEILQQLASNERGVFDNFLQRMRRLGVIVPDEEGGRGAYRFRNMLHFLYFGMEAKR